MIRFCARALLSCALFASLNLVTACGEAPSESAAFLADYRAGYSMRAQNGERFPRTPHLEMTPGSKCDHPDKYRYGEHVPYCERDVKSHRKAAIFVRYDSELGYATRSLNRMQFKIDHHIPLCMGGSNEDNNLWPQHSSVYELTDPAEGYLCEMMSSGTMRQAEAIKIIQEIKQSPERAAQILPGAY